jgi:formylglycine-generating enzyme required for sulfatase activity
MKKILILASNPRKDLKLDREIRDLKNVIEKSRNCEELVVETALAVRVGDLQDLLLRHQPQIVHFCGHGGGVEGLVFESDIGQEQQVRSEALSNLFRLFLSHVDCVLLNACYSEEQATAIVTHINYVVGMQQAIRDDAAIAFSKGFYRALGYAFSVEEAFEFGCNAIQLEISGSAIVRSVVSEAQRKAEVVRAIAATEIPEHLKPILLKNASLGIKPMISVETKAEIQVEIDRSLEDSPEKLYRDRVREFLADRKLSPVEVRRLERLRKDLRLSELEARFIEAEEQEPILKGQEEYEEILDGLIKDGYYPFSPETLDELLMLRRELGLTDGEVEMISQPILVAADEEYQEQVAIAQREREASERQQQQERDRREQLQRQRELERQRQEEERRQEEEKCEPPLKAFEFQSAITTITKTEEPYGMWETKTCNTSYQKGGAEYFVEDFNGAPLEMVVIPGGIFTMGSPDGELERMSRESPQHLVIVQPFYMGKFAVTQAQWRSVAALPKSKLELKPEPSFFKGDQRPVEKVSWDESMEFCDRLSQKTGRDYRLPSEAEWEYACRAGTTTPFGFGETITFTLANYDAYEGYGVSDTKLGRQGETTGETTDVESFPPNAFGLYDMHGNVWEWCADHWHEDYQGAPTDGSAWGSGDKSSNRLLRGGSWVSYPAYCRSAIRYNLTPDRRRNYIGFRVVCSSARTS